MSLASISSPPLSVIRAEPATERPALWSRLAHSHIAALTTDDAPARAVVTGAAGSGKSSVLRHVRRALQARGRAITRVTDAADLSAAQPDDVLLVDDAHRLDAEALEAVLHRLDDPACEVVVACRPWPRSAPLQLLVRRLQQERPTIVLDRLSAHDVAAWLAAHQRALPPGRVEALLTLCGGVPWLVVEALHLDDEVALADEQESLRAVSDALSAIIAHRLRTIDPEVRDGVELICLLEGAPTGWPEDPADTVVAAAHAEGLLLMDGTPAPVVREAVQATVSPDRLLHLLSLAPEHTVADTVAARVREPRLADRLLRRADSLIDEQPERALALFALAADAGADAATAALGRARAAWALGSLDAVGVELDRAAQAGTPAPAEATDLAAALWSARGLTERSHAIHRAHPPTAPRTAAASVAVAFAVGDGEAARESAMPTPQRVPSTLDVASELLVAGLQSTLDGDGSAGLGDLVRAAEMHTASGSAEAVPELPAVIAATAALQLGEPDVAATVLADAVRGGHGGAWAHDRLQLWSAWVAMQRERPHEAEAARARVRAAVRELSTRDRIVSDAVAVGVARRFGDAAALATAWRGARESLLRVRFDLFILLPLTELTVTAARLGEGDRIADHFDRAVALTDHLGSPALWSTALYWAGVQRGILSNDPESLKPHARRLLSAAARSRTAATMAQAGRVWTDVLAGRVDPDAVESAASQLASIGLAWDGARLAGHGAGRTDDRRVAARLLACARQLHPREDTAAEPTTDEGAAATGPALSAREQDVAQLVLQGKTYAEIGAAIFISPRTAEHHIARIRQRLGATSRSDLLDKLRGGLAAPGDSPSPLPPGAVP
ncbi:MULTISPECIES: LuxR C-terminal-related transcriptional regulator [unclassified Microbacterium]|uniref:LuxR C-terminal-related transcriptional regulator n=1 Tax=unclassified Microbacterium TaxID=2609290 RepID=UPI00214CFA26|nr:MULTISPECIES: LuxR C-terminal-related transcriptional regulator [unclassified Microbacterium]MCR2785030.1 LuxR C-terminal-related transcriptional regulator [Microbacterium sp. zg.B96]WIM16568.1 LuxR C-terminal-related transcriptional regulator [Microbacterium sp. zg-B96]